MKRNKFKKIVLLFFIFALLYGCEKKFDAIIDPQSNNHELRLLSISAPDSLILTDSTGALTFSVKLNAPEFAKAVYLDVFAPSHEKMNLDTIKMMDDGNLNNDGDKKAHDSVYSAILTFRKSNENGKYDAKFYAVDLQNSNHLLGVKSFYFRNGTIDYPPEIFNLTMPDTAFHGVAFTFSVEVKDSNGLNDIPDGGVFYQLEDPSGKRIINSHGISKFPLSDKGDTSLTGDAKANDGVFTQRLNFPANQPTGKWKFTFQAIDKSDSTSNILIHYLILQ